MASGSIEHVPAHDLLHGDAREDALDRQLELLAGERARDRRHGDDVVRPVSRRQLRANEPFIDPLPSRRSARRPGGARRTARARPSARDGRRGCRAPRRAPRRSPYSSLVPRRTPPRLSVASERPVIIDAAPLGEHDPVAVAHDPGEVLEVRGSVARAVGVVPEAHGHRGHRLADDELAELADDWLAVRIERRRIDAEAWRAHLAGVDRQQRVALHESCADVRASAAVVEVHVRIDLLVQPLVALQRQRRARLRRACGSTTGRSGVPARAPPCGRPS